MADPFVAEIRIFPFNYAPRGWASCDGQLMPISQNTALFSLLGTTYGGDGRTTFALPNLRGRVPMMWGQGPGLSRRDLGESAGAANVTLAASELPTHTHTVKAGGEADTASPSGAAWAAASAVTNQPLYGDPADSTATMANAFADPATQPHNNMQPYLTMHFCIAMQGVFPPRG